jgi:hypothetical protein
MAHRLSGGGVRVRQLRPANEHFGGRGVDDARPAAQQDRDGANLQQLPMGICHFSAADGAARRCHWTPDYAVNRGPDLGYHHGFDWTTARGVHCRDSGNAGVSGDRALRVGSIGSGYVSRGEPRDSQLDSTQRTRVWQLFHDGRQRLGSCSIWPISLFADGAFWVALGVLHHIYIGFRHRSRLVCRGSR